MGVATQCWAWPKNSRTLTCANIFKPPLHTNPAYATGNCLEATKRSITEKELGQQARAMLQALFAASQRWKISSGAHQSNDRTFRGTRCDRQPRTRQRLSCASAGLPARII